MQRHSHHLNLRSFEVDVFNTQNPETTQNRINSALDRLETLTNNTAIENISQSTKDRIQALANSLNASDITKTLRKITEVLEELTTQQANTSNEPTLQKQTTATDPPQKRAFATAAASRKVVIRVPTLEEPPSLRYHPRRVTVIIPEKPPVHARAAVNKIVSTIKAKLRKLGASFKVQSASRRTLATCYSVPTPEMQPKW